MRPFIGSSDQYDPSAAEDDDINLRRLLMTLRRRKWVIAVVTALSVAAGYYLINSLTPRYTAEAVLVLQFRERQYVDLEAVVSGLSGDRAAIESELDILRSRALARRIVDRLGLRSDPEFNARLAPAEAGEAFAWVPSFGDLPAFVQENVSKLSSNRSPTEARETLPKAPTHERTTLQVVDAVRGNLNVFNDGESYTMFLRFTSQDPAKAARIANAYAEAYLQIQLEAKREVTGNASQWLRAKLAEARQRVEKADAAVQRFREQHGLVDLGTTMLTTEKVSILTQQLLAASADQTRIAAQLREAERLARASAAAESAPTSSESGVVQALRIQEAEVSRRLAELRSRFGEGHPDVRRAEAELASLRSRIRTELDRAHATLRSEAAAAARRVDALESQLERLRGRKEADDRALVELRQLETEADAARKLFEIFLAGFGQTSAQTDNLRPDAKIVSPANTPLYPSYPPRRVLAGLSFAIGIGLSLALVVLLEFLDRGFRGSEQLERLFGLPVLGLTPTTRFGHSLRRNDPCSYALEHPMSPFAESMRSALTAIRMAPASQLPKVILFTSAVPEEGKSTTAMATAVLAAEDGFRTALVECDFRRPHFRRRRIQPSRSADLDDVLTGEADFDALTTARLDERGPVLFTVRGRRTDGARLLQSPRMQELLHCLRQNFDVVILDTPPAALVADAVGLSRLADVTVVLVRWGRTPRSVVTNAMKKLVAGNVAITGMMLTRVDVKRQAAYGFDDYPRAYAKRYYTA